MLCCDINYLFLVHPCDKPNRGGCEQICKKKGDGAVCQCKAGFILSEDGKQCDPGKER